ncbi:MAG: hypothetical protein MZV63_25030 [Marinilabiliales bacterium]|nr:hypothetical protein [Marinilabiliales bacterium]
MLVDFWAAWCPRAGKRTRTSSNCTIRTTTAGFDIYQVSLDHEEEKTGPGQSGMTGWAAGLMSSDLKYRDSEVVKRFGLSEIPCKLP